MVPCQSSLKMGIVTDTHQSEKVRMSTSPMVTSFNYLLQHILSIYYNHLNKPFSQITILWSIKSFHQYVDISLIYSLESDVKAYWLLNHYCLLVHCKCKKKEKTWNHRKCLASTQTHSQWTNHYCVILSLQVFLLHTFASCTGFNNIHVCSKQGN